MTDARDRQAPAAGPGMTDEPEVPGPEVAATDEPDVLGPEVVTTDEPAAAEVLEPEAARSSEELRAALAEAEQLRDEYLDQLRRARADYDNLNRRKTRELMDALDRGAAAIVAQLLGVLDNFDLALDSARGSEDERLVKGVTMVYQGLLDVLEQAGLQQVPGVGERFDPSWHEALLQVDADEPLDEPIVAEVLRPGYRFKGRILRPASVKVAQ